MKITPEQNAIDAANMCGEHNPSSKLTNADVAEIFRRVQAGEPQRVVAAAFRTSQTNVSMIMTNRTWGHFTRHLATYRDGYDPDAAMPRGAAHHNAVLTEELVREIRRRADSGESKTDIARDVGVSDTTVRSIALRRTWKHVA